MRYRPRFSKEIHMRFSDLKIGARLGLGFGLVLVLMLVLGIFTISRLTTINDETQKVTDDRWPKAKKLSAMKDNVNISARALRNMVLVDDPAEVQKEKTRILEARENVGKAIDELDRTIASTEGKAQMARLKEKRGDYLNAQKVILELIDNKKIAEAKKELFGNVRKSQTSYFSAIDELIAFQGKLMDQAGDKVEATVQSTRNLTIALLAAAFILALLFAAIVARSITRPIDDILARNSGLARGDLTIDFLVDRKDEIGMLQESSRQLAESLRVLLGQISDTSAQVASASNQLHAAAE